jgi:hypothetical protein
LSNYTVKNPKNGSDITYYNTTRSYPLQYYFVECTTIDCDRIFLGKNDGKRLENSGMLGNVPISYPFNSNFTSKPYEEKKVYDKLYSPFFIETK